MGRRHSQKVARRKEAKRQRLADKRGASARRNDLAPDSSSPNAARSRLTMLRDAVLRGDAPAPRGLMNLGNTCYFNSVLQNLARVSSFRDYFVGSAALPGEGSMTAAFRSFLIAMWNIHPSHSALDLSTLLDNVAQANSSFTGRAQHDAHELMRVVFDVIVEEEKKRLTNVARGVYPDAPLAHVDHPDDESVNSQSTSSDETSVDKHMSDQDTESTPLKEPDLESSSSSDGHNDLSEVPDIIHLPPPPSLSLPLPTPDPAANSPSDITNDMPPDASNIDKDPSDKCEDPPAPIPPEKLVTIIEEVFGGLLSSTIHCTECGSKSSVDEPFFDLQLPLVPKDESDAARDGESDGKRKNNKRGKASTVELVSSEQTSSSNPSNSAQSASAEHASNPDQPFIGPLGPPPPPPPLPPLPRTLPIVSTQPNVEDANVEAQNEAGNHHDVFAELRGRADLREKAEVDLSAIGSGGNDSLSAMHGSCSPPEPPNGDTASAFGDDEDDVDCIQSLFDDSDTESNSPNEAALADIGGMTAFSTGQSAQAGGEVSAPPKTPPPVKKTTSNTPRRGGSIFSFLNGFGGSGAAPHGYRSLTSSLEEFTKVEVLEGENAYGCDECTRREKLRIALEQRKGSRAVCKKGSESEGISSPDNVPSVNVGAEGRDASQEKSVMAPQIRSSDSGRSVSGESKATDTEEQVLMSSPVTSSESSSGVSSEDDGELVIEEELVKRQCVSTPMTRDEEDVIVNELKVKVPVVRTRAEKRMIIKNPPKVLAIQLKRFTQLGFRGRLGKMTGHVEFGSKLDLTKFVSGNGASDGDSKSGKQRIEYILTGIAVHCGSLSGGHYVSYVCEGMLDDSRGPWYLCNDSRISRSSEKDVLGSEAYLLFYERIDNSPVADNM